jgi:hypothetical protein
MSRTKQYLSPVRGTPHFFTMLATAPCRRSQPIVPGRKEERFLTQLPIKLEGGAGEVRNVSASGIYFVTDVALKEGQPVKFTLEFLDFPSGPLAVNCLARIVRLEEQGTRRGVAASISSFEFRRIAKPGEGSH